MTGVPWLWLIAGPNGAGKSTFAPTLSSVVDEIVRPDELALNLSSHDPESVALEAGRKAIARIRSLLGQRRPFAIETTLAVECT
jgi:predicted ABC-type ATPase